MANPENTSQPGFSALLTGKATEEITADRPTRGRRNPAQIQLEKLQQIRYEEESRKLKLENDRTEAKTRQEDEAHRLQMDANKAFEAQKQQSHDQILEFRRSFGRNILRVVIAWKFLVLTLLALVGCQNLTLPDSVLLALVTTTTANILGLLVIVLKFVFPLPEMPSSRSST